MKDHRKMIKELYFSKKLYASGFIADMIRTPKFCYLFTMYIIYKKGT
jgi:hypothetical protein